MSFQFEIRELTFSYPGAELPQLDHVSLNIERGSYTVVCGRSGSGKTTLLRHLKTVLTPYGERSGEVLLDGTPLERVSQREQAEKVGYVMQNPDDQIVTDKVWHELAFGLESLGCSQTVMRSRVAEMACYFGIQDWFHREVAILSGGQKQLLNLASIMAMHPQVLILDEPTSQLDPIAASDFLNTVRKINLELGTTVILTEHRLEDIFPYADRAVVLEAGKVIADGSPRSIGRQLWESHAPMFAAMPTPVRVFYGAGGEGDSPLTVREGRKWLSESFPQGAAVRELPAKEPPKSGEKPALEAKELWFRYERESPDVLRGVSLRVYPGTLHAIVGGNGAGKSTALKAFAGLIKPYRGKVAVLGKPLDKYKPGQLYKGGIAMLPQDPRGLFSYTTLEQELEEMTPDRERIAEAARLCQVEELLKSHPQDLSGGEQQRAALAKVLLTEPKVLLLDEPTKGIDSFFKERLAGVLRELRDRGIAITLVSHDVEFCARYADFVSMFFDGQILTTDSPRQFFGGNSFYTTAANRMSRHVFSMAVTGEDVVELVERNRLID
ncbi:MAG: ATP-binding cassette domain-containing protein [Candidatus Faecousia sp.]|nr:ATP-binding cassette domain-containing protein [Candidatus Faecousia sp.]